MAAEWQQSGSVKALLGWQQSGSVGQRQSPFGVAAEWQSVSVLAFPCKFLGVQGGAKRPALSKTWHWLPQTPFAGEARKSGQYGAGRVCIQTGNLAVATTLFALHITRLTRNPIPALALSPYFLSLPMHHYSFSVVSRPVPHSSSCASFILLLCRLSSGASSRLLPHISP